MKLRYTVLAILSVVIGAFLFGRCGKSRSTGPMATTAAPLPINDTEQLIVDPRNHTLIVKRPGNTTVTHLPDRPTVIDVQKDGTVKITASQYGLEHRLFIGAGYSDALRFGVGMDGLYWKALDIGGGLQLNSHGTDAKVFVGVSYTIKDSMRVTLTYDHTQHVGAMLTLRI